jgi:hypothetical protein
LSAVYADETGLDMTPRHAKIDNRTVADGYSAVTDKVDALYGQPQALPADAIGPKMARLRREHHRLLGNGYCTRLAELGCVFESICETCTGSGRSSPHGWTRTSVG